MSTCMRCGATFGCGVKGEGTAGEPCWCTRLPPVVPVPRQREQPEAPGCWCPACLAAHIAAQREQAGSNGD